MKTPIVLSLALLAISCQTNKATQQEGELLGAYYSHEYHNYFADVVGVSEQQVTDRMNRLWDHFFTPGDITKVNEDGETTVYYEPNDSMAFIFDVASHDVRTEGMSYGMMISVQMDKPQQFDKLWRWAKTYMQYDDDSPWSGYFCWQCHEDGTKFGNSNASDGEIYFATALFLAAHRWNMPQYAADAQDILDRCMTKDGTHGVWNLFDEKTRVVTFVPTDDAHLYTDPSYQLPAFMELWADWSNTRQDFWREAADSARQQLRIASHPTTGLYPDYSTYEGEPFAGPYCSYDSRRFQYDAIRCAMNIGMDYYLFGKDRDAQAQIVGRMLGFFKADGFRHGQFELDGTNPTGDYSEGMIGANAVGSIALQDKELQHEYMKRLWDTPSPTGFYRYYNGMVYMLSMLQVSGYFRIY